VIWTDASSELGYGILRFADELYGHTVCLYEDNQAVVAIIKNHTSSSPLPMNELRLLMTLLEQLDIRLVSRYIRSELNPTDFCSRLTDRDAWTLSVALCAAYGHTASGSDVSTFELRSRIAF
jgi:hypothetical protein